VRTSTYIGATLSVLATSLLAPAAAAKPPALELLHRAETGSMPKGASLSPDGNTVYVTNFGQRNRNNITVLDAHTLAPKGRIDVAGNVVESVLSPDGKTLYVSNFGRNSVEFLDIATKTVTREVKTETHPKILVLSPDGRSLFAANWASASVTQIDVATGTVVRTLATGPQPRGMAMTRAGTLFVANFNGASIDVFKGSDLSQRTRVPACAIPRHLALSPDDKTLFVSCYTASQVHAYDVATMTVTKRVPVGSSPKSLEVSRDGRYVYTADYGIETNSVSVIDTRDFTSRVFPIRGMQRGSGVAVAPDGRHAYVTGWLDSHVYMVGLKPEAPAGKDEAATSPAAPAAKADPTRRARTAHAAPARAARAPRSPDKR
jgi:YVTN family beta-propeller protein